MSEADEKQTLCRYLQEARDALLWKLEERVTDFYRRAWAHSDAVIEELPRGRKGSPTRRCPPCSYT